MDREHYIDADFLLGGQLPPPVCEYDDFVTCFINRLEQLVRYEFFRERACFQEQSVSELMQSRIIKWDGGCYKDGTRFPRFWPRLLRLLVEIEVHPRRFIESQLSNLNRRDRSTQSSWLSSDAILRCQRYNPSHQERPLWLCIEDACQTIHNIAIGATGAGLEARRAWAFALGMGSSDVFQPLAKYAIARAANFTEMAASHRDDSIELLIFRRSDLLEHCHELIDDSLLADVDRIRDAILNRAEGNYDG